IQAQGGLVGGRGVLDASEPGEGGAAMVVEQRIIGRPGQRLAAEPLGLSVLAAWIGTLARLVEVARTRPNECDEGEKQQEERSPSRHHRCLSRSRTAES